MAIVLSDNVQTNAPKPSDSRYLNNLVPYSSTTEATTTIVAGVRYSGLTVNVDGSEYWWKDGIEDVDLILKTTGGGSATSGENVTKEVSQSSHGFAIKDFIGWSGGTYNKAIANGLYDGEFVGLITEVPDGNTFKVTQSGYITGLTGVVNNTTYFLSENTTGLITDTAPTGDGEINKAVLIANSTTSGWVLPYAGVVVSTGATSISTANNGLTDNGGIVQLGGTLCQHTVICGDQEYGLCFCDIGNVGLDLGSDNGTACSCVRIVPTGINLYSRNSTGNINIQRGSGTTIQMLNFGASSMLVCDGVNSEGLVYKSDYSTVGETNCRWIPDAEWVITQIGGGGCGDYSLTSPATCTVGGVSPGYVMTGKTLECILQDAFAPYVEPAFSSFLMTQTTPMEVGDALSGNKDFSWNTTTSANVTSGSIGICEVGGSLIGSGFDAGDSPETLDIGTKTNTSPTTWTWQITGCSTQDTAFSRNVGKCSVYPYYWGVETDGARPTVTNALVNTGTKVHTTNSCSTVTVDFNSSTEFTWVAIPTNNPSTVPIRNCWYQSEFSSGAMGNAGNKYPDVCTLDITSGDGCWSTISYKVYMSNIAWSDADPIQFRS